MNTKESEEEFEKRFQEWYANYMKLEDERAEAEFEEWFKAMEKEYELEIEANKELYESMLDCVGCKSAQEAIDEGFARPNGALYVSEDMWILPDGRWEDEE
jgi:hypothetical protein